MKNEESKSCKLPKALHNELRKLSFDKDIHFEKYLEMVILLGLATLKAQEP
jgi:hypothetical protein